MISWRDFIRNVSMATTAVAVGGQWLMAAESKPPNIVFILADDLGWKDLGCYGSTFYETPHIDRLAKSGVRFTDAYAAAPLCSATRASILSGWAPARQHLHGVTPESEARAQGFHPFTSWRDEAQHRFPKVYPLTIPKQLGQFPLERTTFAERLKEKGYVNSFIGKWHLGPDHNQFPDKQGFDHTFAISHKGYPPTYHAPYRKGKYVLEGVAPLTEQEYLTDRLTDEAVDWMEKNREKPFCLYMSHYSVHGPWESRNEYKEYFEGNRTPGAPHDNAVYAGMIKSLDDSVGRLVAKVKELGLDEDTVFIFFSDNGGKVMAKARGGGAEFKVTSMHPLRGEKGLLWEGGIRVPCIVRWTGRIKGNQVSRTPIISTDFFPTLLAMAGLSVNKDNPVDGTDLTPLLNGETIARTHLTWFMPHYMKAGEGLASSAAIRAGDCKLVKYFEGGGSLHNLKADIGEARDLSQKEPALFKRLDETLMRELRRQNAHFPIANSEYRPKPGEAPAKPKTTETPRTAPPSKAGEQTSKTSRFLEGYLKKNPAADADRDGILTGSEFKKHKAGRDTPDGAEKSTPKDSAKMTEKKVWLGCAAPAWRGPSPPKTGGLFKEDYLATMTDPEKWKSVLPYVKGVTMRLNDFHFANVNGKKTPKMSDEEIRDYVSFVEKHNLLYGVEIGGLRMRMKKGPSKEMMSPTEYVETIELPLLKRWTDAGGRLDLVATDHAIAYTVKETPEKSWGKAIEMFAEAMAAFHKAHPRTRIGIFESLGYFDVPLDNRRIMRSVSTTTPAISLQDVLKLTEEAFKRRNVPLDFFILDYQIQMLAGDYLHLHRKRRPERIDPLTATLVFDKVHAARRVVKEHGLDFYFLFTPGAYGHRHSLNELTRDQADERAAKVMERVFTAYVEDGGGGDELFIYTWHAYPSYVGPESRDNSFMNVAKKITSSKEYQQFWRNSTKPRQ